MSIIKCTELAAHAHKMREVSPAGGNPEGFQALFPRREQDGLYHQKGGASFPKIEKGEGPASAKDPNTVAQKQLKLFAELIEREIK